MTTANIATMPGREDSLRRVLIDLSPQVDLIRIYFNEMQPPEWLSELANVEVATGPNLQAMGKFHPIHSGAAGDEIYLTCDDDLIYPPDYVQKIRGELSKHPHSIVAFHGRCILGKGNHYYNDNKCYHHARPEVAGTLHTVGTGCTAFNTANIKPRLPVSKNGRMVDVTLGLWAAQNGVECRLIAHPVNYIRNHPTAQKDGVWLSQRLTDCTEQNRMADEILDHHTTAPKVSIIIPYDRDRGWLNEAVTSVENQIYPGEIELILSEGPGKNKSTNLNRGASEATGVFIKYLDEDDRLQPECVADSVAAFRAESNIQFIHGDAVVKCETNGSVRYHHAPIQRPTIQGLKKRNSIHGGTTMYRRAMWDDIGGFDESLDTCEEFEFHLRALSAGYRIGYCPKFLAMYRRHERNKSLGVGSNQAWRQSVREGIRSKY